MVKSPDIVVVEWIDACHYDGWQFGRDTGVDASPVWTVGFLIKKQKEGYLIAQTWYPDDTANLIFIPKGMVTKFTVLGDLKYE